jgi:hypothetical protein
MKKNGKTGKKIKAKGARSADGKIQFAVPGAMMDAVDRLRDDSRTAGIPLTRSHVARRGLAEYLAAKGYLPKGGVASMLG